MADATSPCSAEPVASDTAAAMRCAARSSLVAAIASVLLSIGSAAQPKRVVSKMTIVKAEPRVSGRLNARRQETGLRVDVPGRVKCRHALVELRAARNQKTFEITRRRTAGAGARAATAAASREHRHYRQRYCRRHQTLQLWHASPLCHGEATTIARCRESRLHALLTVNSACLEKRVAENAVRFCGSVQIG
jgi:hypothetical protein